MCVRVQVEACMRACRWKHVCVGERRRGVGWKHVCARAGGSMYARVQAWGLQYAIEVVQNVALARIGEGQYPLHGSEKVADDQNEGVEL